MNDIGKDIIGEAAKGNLEAFEKIYNAMSGFVYNVALRMTHNPQDAEEVSQEVFLILYRKLKDFQFSSSLKTWVYRIVVNISINFRRNIPGARYKTVEFENTLAPETESEMQQKIEQEHQGSLVVSLLNVLNSEQRACVVLRNLEGLSYEQIAESLQININTVRSRLKRAREKMLAHQKKAAYESL